MHVCPTGMGSEAPLLPELVTLAQIASRPEANAEDTCKCLASLQLLCQSRLHEMPQAAARTSLRALASATRAALQRSLYIKPETVSIILDFIQSWNTKDDYIVLEGLELLGEVVQHMRRMTLPFPPEKPLSRVCLEIIDLLRSNSDACQQAAAMRTLYTIFESDGDVLLDDTLKRCAESVLDTIIKAAAGSDGASFALQVYALASLQPFTSSFCRGVLPKQDLTDGLLATAKSIIQHLCRDLDDAFAAEEAPVTEVWGYGRAGHSHAKVGEKHVLAAFGALPGLLDTFAHDGISSQDEEGNTVLHRLAEANMPKCMEMFLSAAGPNTQLHLANRAGLNAMQLAAATCSQSCLALLREAESAAYLTRPAKSAPVNKEPLAPTQRAEGAAPPGGMAGLSSRAMARASSMPLPPLMQLNSDTTDSPTSSLNWADPSGLTAATQVADGQLMRFKVSQGLQHDNKGSLFNMGSIGSSINSTIAARHNLPAAPGREPGLTWSPPLSTADVPDASQAQSMDLQERKRIVELALARLDTNSDDGSDEGQQKVQRSTAYFQNPAGSLPPQSNPFAEFQEAQMLEGCRRRSMGNMSIDQLQLQHLASSGPFLSRGLGLEGNSPPQTQGSLAASMPFDSASFRPSEWEEELMRKAARSNEWEGMSTPSTRMWLGNIAAHVTIRSLYEVFGRFGRLTDAAVFPARIGPLGYAFVNFHRVEDAVQAYSALHNTAVPPLTGSKQLKMRFKPAQQSKSMGEGGEHIVPTPSKHLWVGNIPTRPNKLAIEELFNTFGPVSSVRVFPGKTFAFVNYDDINHATAAMKTLDAQIFPPISGSKPMVVRFQTGPPTMPLLDQQERLRSLGSQPSLNSHSSMLASHASLASQVSLGGFSSLGPGHSMAPMRHSSLPSLSAANNLQSSLAAMMAGSEPSNPDAHRGAGGEVVLGPDGEPLIPAINLSNRLNPNNMHFDRELAALYKNMTKAEKEALWAEDRSQQQLLNMQAQDQLPTDLSMLGLPPQQASLLANHLAAGGSSLDAWGQGSQLSGNASSWNDSLSARIPQLSGLVQQQGQMQGGLQGMAAPRQMSTPHPISGGGLPSLDGGFGGSSPLHLQGFMGQAGMSQALEAMSDASQAMLSASLRSQMLGMGTSAPSYTQIQQFRG